MHVWSCDIGVVMFRNDINLGPSWYTVVDRILSTRYESHSNYQGGKIYQCVIERLLIEFCKKNLLTAVTAQGLFIEYRNTRVMSCVICECRMSSCDVLCSM